VSLLEDIKVIIAENISLLRKSRGMTQIELAELLNYSDKAVSKWERGESVPDIAVLKQISVIFGVTVDYLITPGHVEPPHNEDAEENARIIGKKRRAHGTITGMSVLLVWFVALVVFFSIDLATEGVVAHWLAFAYAPPVSAIVWLVLNSVWLNRRRNYLIISILVWTLILAIHLTLVLLCGMDLWQLYVLGVPGQMIIVLWSLMKKKPGDD
jgi:transcriptional regulator with XRE-family HTH domain